MISNSPVILVTGGAGYIGSHVVRQLSESGYQVIVFDNLSTGCAEALLHGETLIVGDLADQQVLDAVFKTYSIAAVLHFAASIIVDESVSEPIKYYRNNVINTINLLDACHRHGVRNIVFSSTAAVYGIPAAGVAEENTTLAPINPYGASKMMCEKILQDCAVAYGLHYVILRYFNVAGADPESRIGQRGIRSTHLIKSACQTALGKRPALTVYGTDYATKDGTCIRDYIHIEDLANAHLMALAYLEKNNPPTILNVGYGEGHSVLDVIATMKKVSGIDFPVVIGERRDGDPPGLIAAADKIRQILGWQPKYNNLEKIVMDAWCWENKLHKL